MGKGFRKFKRKLWFGTVVRALLAGLSVGAMAVAGQWLYAKLAICEVDLIRYALRAGVPALIAMTVVLICLWPTDRRLARRLDRHLGLGEKVQTMVAFRRDIGDMATLQREDTERILAATPRRRARGACTWLFAALPLVAAFCVVGTVLVPAKEPPAPPPVVDNTWYLDVFREQKLLDLIEEVKASDMEETPRESVVNELKRLLTTLKNVRKESYMKDEVLNSIRAVYTTVNDYNTYDIVAMAMMDTPITAVGDLGNSVLSRENLLISEQIRAMYATLDVADRQTTAIALANAIEQAVTRSGVIADNDFAVSLVTTATALRGVTDEMADDALEELCVAAEDALTDSLEPQFINAGMRDYTVQRLMEIFGIPAEDLPPELIEDGYTPGDKGNYKPDDEDDQLHAGGLGSGEVIFGSDDTIYDPHTDEYIAYGEVLARYYATVKEYISGGSTSEELEDMLYDYFAMLSGGIDKDEN